MSLPSPPPATAWHALTPIEALEQLGSRPGGLSRAEAERRQARFGPNVLQGGRRTTLWEMFINQFRDVVVLVLLGATVISYVLGEIGDAITIVAIVALNAVLGVMQEFRAEQSLQALRRMAAPAARVLRGGEETRLPAQELVPGDMVLLDTGDRIPADVRLLETVALSVEEAALTGESVPVRKRAGATVAAGAPLAERETCGYFGTTVASGRGHGVVTATGMQTEMGQIAGLLAEAEEGPTPLQKRLDQLGKILVVACLILCAVVVAAGLLRQEPLLAMLMTGVSLAVAAIPEGLPAVVTIGLALGVQRMIKANAIVRRLPAVETLGCATIICSDKTGTLTRNEMTVRRVYAGGRTYELSGEGYKPSGRITAEGLPVLVEREDALRVCLETAVLASHAQVVQPKKGGGAWQAAGDPTEAALVVAGGKVGLSRDRLRRSAIFAGEIPFSSERRLMTVVTRAPATGQGLPLTAHVKGAPATVLERCTYEWREGQAAPLTAVRRTEIMRENDAMAGAALRVLAMARRQLPVFDPEAPAEKSESGLIFLGLAGMMDPPRPDAIKAIARCRQAGLRTVMITGDHLGTARAVAAEMGLLVHGQQCLTGQELDQLDDDALAAALPDTAVFARVTPAHKLRIVRGFKQQGEVVAMTGDGVNDAPALKEADIGIAMGQTGTDVAREASAMILTDDNFASIVKAVEQGRGIYDNIRKFVRYLLACNAGEVLTMFLATVAGLPLPLLPIQVLWVNLATDGLPAMALGVDPPDPDVMSRPPRSPQESVFSRGLGRRIAVRGVLIGLLTTGVFTLTLFQGHGLTHARTMAFATLVISQLFHAFACRSETRSVWQVPLGSNPWLVGAVAASALMLLATLYIPALQPVFRTVPLTGADWLVVLVAALAAGVLGALNQSWQTGVRQPAPFAK